METVPHLNIQISFEEKPFTWIDIKQKYLADPKKYKHALKQANWVRASLIKALLEDVITEVDPSKKTTFRADGSTDLTSDFDISMSGPEKEHVAIAFNEQFEDMFDRPSAEVWDTNVYASGPMEETDDPTSEECKGNFVCSSTCTKKTQRCSLISQLRFRHNAAVVNNQHAWSITTLLRNLDSSERTWLDTKMNTTPFITSSLLRRLFARAQEIYKQNPIPEDVRSANQKYAEALRVIYQLRLQSNTHKTQTKDFALQYVDAESRAGYFAQEAYVTMGPFLHVVGADQRQLDMSLSQDEYKDSFIENMAYVLHNFKPNSSCSKSFVMAAKYIARAAFAATQVFDTTEDNIVAELDELVTESTKIRSQRESLLGRAEQEHVEQPMVIHMRGVSCDKQNKSRTELLQWIITYLVKMF